MNSKKLICPERRRRIPEGFGWVDHRLVQDGHFRHCGSGSLSLYLFLITVGDSDGISWYSDHTLSGHLNCDELELSNYRRELQAAGLAVYRRPYYQVLDINPVSYDTETFSALLRKSVRAEKENMDNTVSRDTGTGMISRAYRPPDEERAPRALSSIIGEMLGGEQ
jgi:hypothetical protein